jgi:hypothetical protein
MLPMRCDIEGSAAGFRLVEDAFSVLVAGLTLGVTGLVPAK